MMRRGTLGTLIFNLLQMTTRLVVLLLVIAAGAWFYLANRTEFEGFKQDLKSSLGLGLSASEIELEGGVRTQGQLEIHRFACQGGDTTFFTSLEVRNLRCQMGLFDGLTGQWELGKVLISKLNLQVRAGADDAESAAMLSKALFVDSDKVLIRTLEVADASLGWGYSELTRGSIDHSLLQIQRFNKGLKLDFKGGTFSQNWLQELEIVHLVVICDPQGLTFERAEFRRGQGKVDFSGLKVIGGERPEVSGNLKFWRLGLEGVMPKALSSYLEGSISGDFRVFGSTNTSNGVGFDGQVVLDGEDQIVLRQQVHLLKALSGVDSMRDYYRLNFRQGSFRVKTTDSVMEISDLKLKAGDLFSVEGKLRARLPTAAETKAALEKSETTGSGLLLQNEDESVPIAENINLTLRRAAREAKRAKEGDREDGKVSLFERLNLGFEMRRLEKQASERLSKTLRYEGLLQITLPPNAFERAPKLAAKFPVDPKLGRISMAVPIEGNLYEITMKQAEEIYQLGAH